MVHKLNILLVDNDVEVSRALADQLIDESVTVHIVGSGYEAIDSLKSTVFDCVVTDYYMSQGDGISLAHYCANHAVPCMVVTGYQEAIVMPYLPPGTPIFDKHALVKDAALSREIRGLLTRALHGADERVEKVLVIDDEASEPMRIQRLLDNGDGRFSVEGTIYPEIGLEKMKSNAYDAYLLDYRLGLDTGIDILRKARHEGCRQPILLITALGDSKTAIEAMHSGADDYIDKGEMSAERLKYAISYAIKRRRSDDILAKQQLRIANSQKLSALGEMAVAVAHEIKNPLAIILARAGMMLRTLDKPELDKEKLRSNLHTVEDTCDRIAAIIESLQNHYIASGNSTTQKTAIASMMDDAFNLCRYKAKFERVELRMENCAAEHSLECVPSEFCQMTMNLVFNAIEATQTQDERWIEIFVHVTDNILVLSVTDSGQGKYDEIETAIRQAGSTSKATTGGIGFGLQYVQMIAQKYGGELCVDRASENTCLQVKVPLLQQQAEISKVLVVDDNADMLEIVADRLRTAGLHDLYTAFDGYEAEKMIREQKPDIVVSDINIPGQTGQELLTSVRLAMGDAAPRFVFMTGLRPEEIPGIIVKLGARVFHKPFDMNDLIGELRKKKADQTSA